jgi:hypothetical protein
MLREVLKDRMSQNAKVVWVSRDSVDSVYLAGVNAVRVGSSYDILSVFSAANSKDYGEVHLGYNLKNVNATSKIATFCYKGTSEDCNKTDGTFDIQVPFDQFVECNGEVDTVEGEELWELGCENPSDRTKPRFGPSKMLCTKNGTFPSVDDGIQSSDNDMTCIPYAVGFRDTGHSLRLHGAVAAKVTVQDDEFKKVSQYFLDNGRVTPVSIYGTMLFMGALLQVYASGVLKKKLTKVNVAMDLQEVILQFMTQCGVPDQARRDFLSHLRLVHSGVFRQTFEESTVRWPLHPSGMLPDSSDKDISLNEHIQSRKELSNHVAIQDGVTLVCRQSIIRSFLSRLRNTL